MKLKFIKTKLLFLILIFSLILIPGLVSASDTPSIIWEDPTPTDGGVSTSGDIFLNATITDDNETSAFIDWNYDVLGYWNFESLSATGVYDNSSNSNFMSYGASGPSASDLINGTRGHAMVFDGVNDYIKTDNVIVSNPTELTIGAWLYKTADGPSYECALHHGTATSIGSTSYWLGVDVSNYLTATIGATTGGGWSIGKTGQLATYGQWWHIASTWDGTTVRVYVNGVYNKEYALATYNTLTTATRIGASSNGANYQYKGAIDEVLIVERAFSADEMMALYNSSKHSLSTDLTGLAVGDYNYSAYAIDEDGNINISQQSVIISIPITPTPEINSSDGTRGSETDLNCYDTISDVVGNKFNATVRWYKDDVLNLTLEYNNNYEDEDTILSVLDSGNTSIGDVWKCDMKFYDGTAYSPVGTSDTLLVIDPDPPTITWEDPTPDAGTSTVNDWVYLNTTITDYSETYSFYDWDNSLLGYWSMDASSATGIYDNSSNSNFGSYVGTTLDEDDFITGKYGNALDFIGDTGHVAIDSDPFNEVYDEFSLSYWFKTPDSTTARWQTAVHRNDGTSVGSSTWFGGMETGSNQIVSTIGAGSGAGHMAGTTGVVAVEDTWYYVVASWDGTNVRVYVDNVLKKTYALASLTNKPATMRIGSSGAVGAGYMFNGVVDEVKIFKRGLSVEEINASYGEGKLYHNFTNLDVGTHNYSAYSMDAGGNLNISENREITIIEGDTCTAPGSGKWAITCSDNCTWTTDFTVPDNISITGSGTLTWNANMSFTKAHWEIYKADGCEMVINPGGSIR